VTPKRLAFVVALASLGACSSPAPETLPPIAYEGEVVLLPSTLVGCYRVASLEWLPAASPEGAKWAQLVPATFELSGAALDDGAPDFRRVIAAEPSLRLGIWTLNNQQELIVDFSGLVGVKLVLRRRPTDGVFYGRAHPTSDGALPPGVGVGTVHVKKAGCERA
jgi:hypothetical protein